MSKPNQFYACQNCEPTQREVFRFRGLCRVCTVYDDTGAVLEPFKRQLSDEFGNPLQRIATRSPPVNRSGEYQRVGFRQPKKPSKRQRANVAPEIEIPDMVETLAGGEEE